MPSPLARPMKRRTWPLTGSIWAERQVSITGSQNRMVEPWKARAAGSRRIARGPRRSRRARRARPPGTQPKWSSPVIAEGPPSAPVPVHSKCQEPPKRPNAMSLLACSAARPVTCRDHRSSIRPLGSGQRRDPAGRPHRLRRVGPVRRTVSIAALWLLRYDTRSVPCR